MRVYEFATFVILFVMAYMVGCTMGTKLQNQPQTPPGEFGSNSGEFTSHRATQDGKDMGGVSQRPGLAIHWAGSDPLDDSVRPIDVINTTIDRIQAEQKTDLGSDRNARAMVLLMQAKTELQGGKAAMDDGTPIIQ